MKYTAIWQKIKATGSAEVTVNKSIARTLEQGVKRTKSAENVAYKYIGNHPWSRLRVIRVPISATHTKIVFELMYPTIF